jgi:hypothetical protein
LAQILQYTRGNEGGLLLCILFSLVAWELLPERNHITYLLVVIWDRLHRRSKACFEWPLKRLVQCNSHPVAEVRGSFLLF